MTEASAPARQSEPSEFMQIWSEGFSQVLGQIAASTVPCAVEEEAPTDIAPAGEGELWVVVASSGGLRGEMSLRLAQATVLRLAQIFMSEAATPEAQPTAEHREAVIELLRQIAGVVATSAKPRWGEIQLLVEVASAAPSWSAAETFRLRLGEQGADEMVVEFGLSAALGAALKAEKNEAGKAVGASVTLGDLPRGTGAMDLLMDVRLSMTMRFGAKSLLLREVLDLSPGVVVELDRKIQEPVDLLLDGRLVARGEVVVIEGNYGLRVIDVSPLGPG